ncbi:MAG: patatin-like phospholipase family protein [Micavibrio sp.]|nr:patatin-like phospholipase family protein [Micavibrio sp.]
MENKKKRVFTVLSIDGGGIRGLVPARILQEIEERTGKPISELFDMIGGTSTGAILAAGLSVPDDADKTKPKHSAQDLKNFYYTYGPSIFPEMKFKSIRRLSSSAMYDPKPLEDALRLKLGDAKMKDSLNHLLIPATDIKNFRPVWITHLKGQKDSSAEGWSSMLMRDAVRASTTAPTYFPSKYYQTTPNEDMPNVTHRHALIDGGFFAGNCMRRLMTQAKKLAPPDAEIVVVHLGTGNVENSLSPEEFNKLGPLGMISKSNGNLLLSLVINMSLMDVANDLREEIGDRFISFDGVIDVENDKDAPTATMDDASHENLKALEKFAEKVVKDNDADMERLCEILKHRAFTEERHNDSKLALQALTTRLDDAKTVKTLTRTYQKVLGYASDILTATPEDGDAELKALALRLTDTHKQDLDRMYNVLQGKLDSQNKILNSIKEAGDDITKFVKKIGSPFRELPAPPENDNKPPPGEDTWLPWKRRGNGNNNDKPPKP